MDFEAPNASDVAWLNTGTYVARRVLDAAARTMTLRVYEVSASARVCARQCGSCQQAGRRPAAAVGLPARCADGEAGCTADRRAGDA